MQNDSSSNTSRTPIGPDDGITLHAPGWVRRLKFDGTINIPTLILILTTLGGATMVVGNAIIDNERRFGDQEKVNIRNEAQLESLNGRVGTLEKTVAAIGDSNSAALMQFQNVVRGDLKDVNEKLYNLSQQINRQGNNR